MASTVHHLAIHDTGFDLELIIVFGKMGQNFGRRDRIVKAESAMALGPLKSSVIRVTSVPSEARFSKVFLTTSYSTLASLKFSAKLGHLGNIQPLVIRNDDHFGRCKSFMQIAGNSVLLISMLLTPPFTTVKSEDTRPISAIHSKTVEGMIR